MLLDIGRKVLECLGYHGVARASPIEALELLQTKPDHFDLMITEGFRLGFIEKARKDELAKSRTTSDHGPGRGFSTS